MKLNAKSGTAVKTLAPHASALSASICPKGIEADRATLRLCGSGLVREGSGGSDMVFADAATLFAGQRPLPQNTHIDGQAKRRPVCAYA
ncbi:hypothetical protein CVE31_28705 [Pseudomonas syringae pv. actinidiae]|nr:hypothetical protein [Pseudomonas syringae pv. actinidiae]